MLNEELNQQPHVETAMEKSMSIEDLENQIARMTAIIEQRKAAASAGTVQGITTINEAGDKLGVANPDGAASATEQLREIDLKIAEEIAKGEGKIAQVSAETEDTNNAFEQYDALSTQQKQYLELVNRLKEAEVTTQEQYNENRGLVSINDEEMTIQDFANSPNFENLDFNLKINLQNIDQLVDADCNAEDIYRSLCKLGDQRMIIAINSIPKNAQGKLLSALPNNLKNDFAEKHQKSIFSQIPKAMGTKGYELALMSINLPLREKFDKTGGPESYFKALRTANSNFMKYYENAMSNDNPSALVRVFKEQNLKLLFQSIKMKFIKKEDAIKMTGDMIRKLGGGSNKYMQPDIIKGVLALKRENIITSEEADQILSLGQSTS